MKIILSLFISFYSFLSLSQYGNEWIDYNQQYYSFKITQDGVYKLDYATLNAAGIPLQTIHTANFQIFGFEKEQPIYVEDGGDGSMDAGDYLLFYAQKNNTWLDSLLYENPIDVPNKYYPHYNDTITYFVTWNNSLSNNRMITETAVNYASYSPEPYFLKTIGIAYHQSYTFGFKSSGLSYSQYVNGEGWGSVPMNVNSSNYFINSTFSTPFPYTAAGAPDVTGISSTASISNATFTGAGNHHLQIKEFINNTLLVDLIFNGYVGNKLNFNFPATNLSGSNTTIRHELINDQGAVADQVAIHYVELTYPSQPNLNNTSYYEMEALNGTGSKAYYNFTNFNASAPIGLAFIGNTIRKLPVTISGSQFKVIIPNSSQGKHKFILTDISAIMAVPSISPINGNGTFTNPFNFNYAAAYLMVTHHSLNTSAQTYLNYRQSAAGGNKNALLFDIDELNLQFGGGVPKHVMGLRRFQDFAFNQSPNNPPGHIFLIGKGIREATEGSASGGGMRTTSTAYAQCLIPSFGFPASDMLISAGLNGTALEPLIPIGRLAASNNAEVITYLNKVKEFELAQDPNAIYNIPSKLWQKEILHFGGGTTAYEQTLFKSFLNSYENTLENSYFGGNVNSYFKTVSDPISPILTNEVTSKITDGVSFMTFFGHASATGFDQNVDDPENWNNKGKYPFVIGNSCLTGNIHEPIVESTSETYVLIEDEGAIAFIANVNQGFPYGLDQFSSELFKQISTLNYGGSIGEQMKIVAHNLSPYTNSFTTKTTLSQMTLHGDPALKTNTHENPEIEINSAGVFITPSEINLTVDTIAVNVVLYNLGKAITDTFTLEVKRKFPNSGGDSIYFQNIYGLNYMDTIQVKMPFYTNLGVGLNNFEIKVDIPNIITEQYDEVMNNQVNKQVIFDIDGIYPVWPYNYAVVPNDSIVLKASTINPFADLNNYRFEIDTTDLFNSPFLKNHQISSTGGVIEVFPNDWNASNGVVSPLTLVDSMVYFWRVSVNEPGNYNWQEFSFQYIKGKSGWGQDHFFQFKNNDFNSLHYNRGNRDLTFDPTSKTVHCQTYGNASNSTGYIYTLWELDGSLADYAFCNTNPKLQVAVINPNTLEAWGTRDTMNGVLINPNHNFGNSNDIYSFNHCRDRVEKFFTFEQHIQTQLMSFQDMIENQVPDGYYVLIYTAMQLSYANWDTYNPQLYSMFQNLGSDSIAVGKSDKPYIAFFRKGDISSFKEVYGVNVNDYIEFEDTIVGQDFSGLEKSTRIGPAKNWEVLYWQQHSIDNVNQDQTRLKLYGLTANGNSALILDTIFTENDSILQLSNINNINSFTYLQLEMNTVDSTNNTPTQLDSWHVLYQPLPEAAITSTNGYYISTDTLNEGEKIAISFDIKNISDQPMDSLLINYWVENNKHQIIPISYPRQDSLRVNQTIRDTIFIPSFGLTEVNSLWVEVNPYTTPDKTDQPEMYHFNNIGQLPIYVNSDNINPILEVTFDNQFILNGDLVSPNSQVIMTLKDENPLLLLDNEADTALFGIFLTDPEGNQKRVNFRNSAGEQTLDWVPANASNKKFKIIYDGDFEMDGTYRILVQGADKSGNLSGDYNYDIEFEVDHQSSITNLMNYPNPFSTRTQFVFTLTGAIIPDEMTIQILNITGTVVRTITIDELGPIHIGRNITQYAWDGKDDFGDQLANGVYLYRVISNIQEESIDLRESGADQYFTKGFGKMYLLR
ncbi:hypothetical protein DNU06_11040 [Putridiphycobacter roseus]|uniref:Gingipain domain-containing protein n=1 Tax=Putridiphycobacter roseus TaxID=2219161 RepID=A0A2W1NFJ6_9FLAO|nr:C25 family cysteine peptidase [Putridiphycobacter roseus]PZE16786.1 hypothetical protein DNU06_11040 [Putridiphycobacter roseus]